MDENQGGRGGIMENGRPLLRPTITYEMYVLLRPDPCNDKNLGGLTLNVPLMLENRERPYILF